MAGISFSGLGSGIDTSSIIAQITRFNQQRIDQLRSRQTDATSRQNSVKSIETKLKEVQTAASKLARTVSGTFDARKGTSSDESLIKVAATSSAAPITQTLTVNAIAKANIVSSQGFASSTSEINTGTLQISAGGSVGTITIDSTNNSLKGLASAINTAKVGVRASIVKSGSGAAPYKLLLTSEKTGVDNSISITNNLTTSSGSSSLPNLTTTVQAAQDAELQIGSGVAAVTVSNSTNIFTDVIEGVTLNVQNADATKEVTITVTNDNEGIKTAVKDFITDFNDVLDFIATQTKVDPAAKKPALLSGNRQVSDVANSLKSLVVSANSLLPSGINRFSAFGITLNRQGRLDFNEAKLDALLNGETEGIGIDEIKRGFALTAATTNNDVRLVAGTKDTKESTAGVFHVDVTQAAEVASITATDALFGSTTIDSSNNTLTLKLDGVTSGTITLNAGTYTDQQLADELQTRLNGDSAIGKLAPTVTLSGGKLVVTSARYGSSSEVSTLAGSAITSGVLGFGGAESDTGVDVAGKFIVNGSDETATGAGQTLTAADGNANTAGMRVQVTLTSSQLNGDSTPEAELTVTRGVASKLSLFIDQLLDLTSGRLKTITEKFQSDADVIAKQIEKEQKQMAARTASLEKQFANMDSAVGRSKSNGDALTASLSPLLSKR